MSTVCKSCKQPVTWVKTVNGKNMPIEPSENGNLRLVNGTAYVCLRGEVGQFTSHFSSCPNGAAHRKTVAPVNTPPKPLKKAERVKQKRAERERELYEAALKGGTP